MTEIAPTARHNLPTRLVHAGLAITIVVQLLTSLVMEGPRAGSPGDTLFVVHQYSGYAALAFAFLFWATLVLRTRGTDPGALFPWLSARRLRAVRADLVEHLQSLKRLSLPAPESGEYGALASAVHGLGLLLMTLMAVTGASAILLPGIRGAALSIHELFANLVWAYLIGHASVALIAHWSRHLDIRHMWSLRGIGRG